MLADDFEIKCLGGVHASRIAQIPNADELFPQFQRVVDIHVGHFFSSNTSLFLSIGMDMEDLKSIAMCYLSSFLNHQGISVEGIKKEEFTEEYYLNHGPMMELSEEEYVNKDKAVFTLFLRQRLQSLVKVAIRKQKDVNGYYAREVFYLVDKNSKMKDTKTLGWLTKIERESLGFFKVSGAKVDKIKKFLKNIPSDTFFNFEGKRYFKYRLISINNLNDFYEKTDTTEFENLKERFNSLPETKRLMLIDKFIKKNEKFVSKSEVVELAKQLKEVPRIE